MKRLFLILYQIQETMITIKSLLRSFLILLLFCSCTRGENHEYAAAMEMAVPDMAVSEAGRVSKQEEMAVRKVITRGEIRFQTRDVNETSAFISGRVKESGGYISSDNIFNSDDRVTQRIEIRVPSEKFDLLLSEISEKARNVDYKNVGIQDVTEEYIDVEARIRTKKELENRYRELLLKARTVEEILSIEKELGTLRSDIESIEGRLRYLSDQVSYSTLSVEFYQLTATAISFSSKTGQALLMGWRWFLAFIIGLLRLWPFIVIIGLSIFAVIRYRQSKLTNDKKSKHIQKV